MKKGTLFFCIISFLLVLQAIFTIKTFYFPPSETDVVHSKKIPLLIGEWSGTEYPVEEFVMRILETKDILYRRYKHPKEGTVYLSIVFSEDNRKTVHPPEVCYTGGGWEVMADISLKKQFAEKDIKVKELKIEKDMKKQIVWYFFKSGERLSNSYHLQQLNIVFNKLLGKAGNAALIRLSAEYDHKVSENDACASMQAFMDDALLTILEKLP